MQLASARASGDRNPCLSDGMTWGEGRIQDRSGLFLSRRVLTGF